MPNKDVPPIDDKLTECRDVIPFKQNLRERETKINRDLRNAMWSKKGTK